MSERAISFSTPMMPHVLSGAKTQTRRLVKPQPPHSCRYEINGAESHALCVGPGGVWVPPTPRSLDHRLPCPYGRPGDLLWVKETWTSLGYGGGFGAELHYKADGHDFRVWEQRERHRRIIDPLPNRDDKYRPTEWGAWRSPRFMPRWASRITLEITRVRVERVQTISSGDVRAEGVVTPCPDCGMDWSCQSCLYGNNRLLVMEYAKLWDALNGKRAPWSENPYAWALEFKRVEPSV